MRKNVFIVFILFAVGSLFAAGVHNESLEEACVPAVWHQDADEEQNSGEKGPTINLGYDKDSPANPILSFMYFVPMVSPALVKSSTSYGSKQQCRVISYEKTYLDNSFRVVCEFEMKGDGTFKNHFVPQSMFDWNLKVKYKNGQTLAKLLDFINFEGEGFGKLVIEGKIKKGKKVITDLAIHFDDKEGKSPVTVGLYDVEYDNGRYSYENRHNRIVVRVNTLTFKNDEKIPRMGLKLASVGSEKDCDGLWSRIKGKIANFLIDPIRINEAGNKSMLDFGLAIAEQKDTFIFPKADNLVENTPLRVVNSRAKNYNHLSKSELSQTKQ